MRYGLILAGIFALPLYGVCAEEPEIVIELTGSPSAAPAKDEINIWDKTTPQLEKILHGLTREEALRRITNVSTRDTLVESSDGKRYAFVQYGRDRNYRKCLFRRKDPQTFVACAANTQESLALAQTYHVDIGITEEEFLRTYQRETAAVFLPIPNGQSLYQIKEQGKPTRFFLFTNKQFTNELSALQARQLVQTQQQTLNAQQKAKAPKKPKTFKALIDGGTLTDQMYMPRVINGENLPHLIPSKTPAGQPLWPQNLQP